MSEIKRKAEEMKTEKQICNEKFNLIFFVVFIGLIGLMIKFGNGGL